LEFPINHDAVHFEQGTTMTDASVHSEPARTFRADHPQIDTNAHLTAHTFALVLAGGAAPA
jgi:hypothetical protein